MNADDRLIEDEDGDFWLDPEPEPVIDWDWDWD